MRLNQAMRMLIGLFLVFLYFLLRIILDWLATW